MRQAAFAIQDARVADVDAAKHRSDFALGVVLDAPKALAVHAEATSEPSAVDQLGRKSVKASHPTPQAALTFN
jgi:hypothetical protein